MIDLGVEMFRIALCEMEWGDVPFLDTQILSSIRC